MHLKLSANAYVTQLYRSFEVMSCIHCFLAIWLLEPPRDAMQLIPKEVGGKCGVKNFGTSLLALN